MGHRKSAKRVQVKRRAATPKSFKCPLCSHEGSCEVKLDKKTGTGTIACRVCGEQHQMRTSALSDAVDIYCDWVDACEAARVDDGGAGDGGGDGGGDGAGGDGGGGGEGGGGGGALLDLGDEGDAEGGGGSGGGVPDLGFGAEYVT